MMSASTVVNVLDNHDDCFKRLLKQSSVPALRMVTIQVQEDMVILSGRVPSYYLKQLAQEAVIPHLGQRVLENRITVPQH
jgi:hypothetical protein